MLSKLLQTMELTSKQQVWFASFFSLQSIYLIVYVLCIQLKSKIYISLLGSIVESKYPHIFWTPCVVHCVNLAFCEPTEKSAHYDQCIWLQLCAHVHDIQKFVNTHDMVKAIFKRHTKLQLLSVAETRFASHYVVAERMKALKDALEQMVMDPYFRVLFRSPKNPIDIKARECKERILSDTWWDKLDYFWNLVGLFMKWSELEIEMHLFCILFMTCGTLW